MTLLASRVPDARLDVRVPKPPRAEASFVLYWMTSARRTRHNFGLERAVEWARALDKPLVVLDALRLGYRWASERIHRFVLDGMHDVSLALRDTPALHVPYVEAERGAGRGLALSLAERAAVVVGDDYPAFFLPSMHAAFAAACPTRFELVDSNGLLPMRAAERIFSTAKSFRAFAQRALPEHLRTLPLEEPLRGLAGLARASLPAELVRRYPLASPGLLAGDEPLSALDLDHTVRPVSMRGGARAGLVRLEAFLDGGLDRYGRERSQPASGASSGLSPYLHFGHVGAHEIFARVAEREGLRVEGLRQAGGSREGFWAVSASAEAFLDELVTWRELAFHACALRHDVSSFESLPDWAITTLRAHEADPRPALYTQAELVAGATYDRVWNAAQNELVRDGRIHNYLRMLWGKRLLEWHRTPDEALATMIELNNRFALDGRDPCSYAGITWVLGRYDRPWGPERPIFGLVRYMSSSNTMKKFDLKPYLLRYGGREAPSGQRAAQPLC
jgi:deoxyribodipyrimidine photo-lyase